MKSDHRDEVRSAVIFNFGFLAGGKTHCGKKIASLKLEDLDDIADEYAEKYIQNGSESDIGDFVDSLAQRDKRFDPIRVVVCECEHCGCTFDVCYLADGSYEYASAPCECEAEFHPIDGEPSIGEWLESLF